MSQPSDLITNLDLIRQYARRKEKENFRFRAFVKSELDMEEEDLDAAVRETADSVWSQVDCTTCGHCCRTLQIVVDNDDMARLAKRFGLPLPQFQRRYVRRQPDGERVFASTPCPFLKGNVCTVYEDRPRACRDFPYLHEKGFRQRMLMMIENTELCPIVYNTLERLKKRLRPEKPGR